MRNKIPCSADRLGLLNPQMIQAVSEAAAFQIGHQYLTENRVRIVEADDAQISSAVIGNSGLYEQTIRLREGHLISKCSCALPEEPMCRHCIAVLLEYHRWVQPRQSRKTNEIIIETRVQPQADYAVNGKTSSPQSAAPDVKLSEVMQFVEWLQPAMKAIEKGERVPEPPNLGAGEVSAWIQAIKHLEAHRRESEELQLSLESDVRDREAYVGRLTQQLQASIAEAKTAHTASQELQREAATYKGMLDKIGELVGEIARCEGQMRSVTSEILGKGAQLDKLAGSFTEISEALKSVTKQSLPR